MPWMLPRAVESYTRRACFLAHSARAARAASTLPTKFGERLDGAGESVDGRLRSMWSNEANHRFGP